MHTSNPASRALVCARARWPLAAAALFIALAALTAGCGGGAAGEPAEPAAGLPQGALSVVTTVSPITSIVENIGGDRIALRGIIPEGANSHTYEPLPSTARILAKADLFVANGLSLEDPAIAMFRANAKPGARLMALGDRVLSRDDWQFDFSFPKAAGHPNPHVWPDPLIALDYAALVRTELSALDPSNAAYYEANYREFEARIRKLDAAIRAAVSTVAPEHRVLLTYHDSWAYFARRYGMRVLGAVQPADFSQPSAREVAALITQIRDLDVPAVFGSEVFPSDVMAQVARESGATYITALSDDNLPGAPGDPEHSYLGLMVRNLQAMIPALGGDASAVAGVDIGLVFDGPSPAVYPQ